MSGLEPNSFYDPIEAERARVFALLGHLLAAAPDASLLQGLSALGGNPTALGSAIASLAAAAGATTAEAAQREFQALFIGVGRGELLPYASYYLTGFLHERPLAALRAELGRLGITRAIGVAEPEDHIAFCCEAMAGLVDGRFPGDPDAFMAAHLKPWAARFFADLEAVEASGFYRAVGGLGRTMMDIENAAAELAA